MTRPVGSSPDPLAPSAVEGLHTASTLPVRRYMNDDRSRSRGCLDEQAIGGSTSSTYLFPSVPGSERDSTPSGSPRT